MVEIKGLKKSFSKENKQRNILQDINLTVNPGEWVAVCGKSGSGKTTLANAAAGIIPFDEGVCLIDGQNLSELNEKQKADLRSSTIGMIYQDFNLLSYLTVMENTVLPSMLKGEKPDYKRAESILESLHLENEKNSFPAQISGGQKQRTAIARILYSNASLIIADEPTGNLDRETRDEVLDLFARLKQMGKTLIVITHDPQAAQRAEKIYWLEDGHVRLQS